MPRLVLIDGNSILNRAYYGIAGTNMLKTEDRNLYECCLWILSHYV